MVKIDSIGKIGVFANSVLKFFLGKNDYLQQLVFVGFIVQKFTQNFQAKRRHLLPFVNDQHGDNITFYLLMYKLVLDGLLHLPL